MLTNVRGVIFDIDDTLYTEKYYVYRGFEAVAQFLADKIPAGTQSVENDHSSGRLYARLWDYFVHGRFGIAPLCEELGMPEKADEALAVYQAVYREIELLPGVRELMETLKAHGIKLGVISDGVPESQGVKLEALGVADLMDEVIFTETLGGHDFRKPNPAAFRLMAERLGLPEESLVYIGDNPKKDFAPCLALGMQAVFFKNPEGLYTSRPYAFPFPIAENWDSVSALLEQA